MKTYSLILLLASCCLTINAQSKIIYSVGEGKLNTGETPDLMIYNPVTQSSSILLKGTVQRRGESNAATSTDGKRIIFNTYRFSGWKLGIGDMVNGKITNVKRFTNRKNYEYNPMWSHNSRKVVYQEFSWSTRENEIFVYDFTSKKTTQLTDSEGGDRTPSWTRDDSQIVFTSGRSGNYDIHIMGKNGEDVQNLTMHKAQDFAPSCSSKEDKISFLSNRNNRMNLFVLDLGSNQLTNLTPNIKSNSFVMTSWQDSNGAGYKTSWSPDGKQIVFNVLIDGDLELFIINADGTGLKQITDNTDSDFGPFWMSK